MNTKEEQKQYLSFVESIDELLNDFYSDVGVAYLLLLLLRSNLDFLFDEEF